MDAIIGKLERRFDNFDTDPSSHLRAEADAAAAAERSTQRFAMVLIPVGLIGVLGCFLLLQSYRRRSEAAAHSALQQHRSDARTDDLTGLANRRALIAAMEERLAEGQGFVLGLADLNGFKHYNDTFGHAAGDSLLRRLAQRLLEATGGDALAARLGGDEFCVLAGPEASVEMIKVRTVAALGEEGHGFRISSACGAVRVPQDAADIAEALRVADARMYADKGSSRTTTERQMSGALLRMLDERHPGLGSHVEEVAELAVACAEGMGLSEDAVEIVRHAAELHDIGKVAIPDAILQKPGPLSREEWQFMRQHTIIGERVLAVIPSMQTVSRVVRWSHERWDGDGYPDKLAADAIPLPSRILAVADAYCAMTEDRPYVDARTREEAVLELRRCAGAQFDPRVVRAFVAALSDRPVAAS